MIGRDQEIARVLALVENAEHRLITVTGRGGVGKSSLAFHVARTVSASGHCAVTVVPLAALVDPNSVLDEIADALAPLLDWDRARHDAELEQTRQLLNERHGLDISSRTRG
jgi:predicted ATPase